MRPHYALIAVVTAAFTISCSNDTSASTASEGSISYIVDGSEDSRPFPEVCTITWSDPSDPSAPRFSMCTGTLLSPTVLLTAGHCTFFETFFGLGKDPKVSCDPVFIPGVSSEHGGRLVPIPSMDPWNDVGWDPDVGVVLLDEPIRLHRYASLPDEDLVTEVFGDVPPKHGPYITVVGYGLTADPAEPTGTRRVARNRYAAMTDMFLGATPSFTRLGDSGAPAFLASSRKVLGIDLAGPVDYEDMVIDVFTRVDRPDVLEFLHQYVPRGSGSGKRCDHLNIP